MVVANLGSRIVWLGVSIRGIMGDLLRFAQAESI